MKTEVIRDPAVKDQDLYVVVVDGQLTTPRFTQIGPAKAYEALLQNGTRKPELPRPKGAVEVTPQSPEEW